MSKYFSLILFVVSFYTTAAAQPVISYLLPDIGAPGMVVYIELVGPNTGNVDGTVFSITDSLFANNTNDAIRLECVRPADRSKITFSPIVISWNGRLLSTIAFISPTCAPNSSDWRLLADAWRIPVQVITPNSGTKPSIDTFYIVSPTHLGDIRSNAGTVLGAGTLGNRSRRGAMIVDSLILKDATYTVSLSDPDGIASNGNQGYLPFVLMSVGQISGSGPNSVINASATGMDGGAGGGGGGGQFCDLTSGGSDGGSGYTGGGRGGRNTPNSYKNYGSGSGKPSPDGSTNSLNETRGSLVNSAYESAGGGTGHPFCVSGAWCGDGVNCIPDGGFGGASGEQNNKSGAGGGYATNGAKTNGIIDNGGQAHGNTMCIPLAGGSGGSSGNPRALFGGCAGAGGGGGGALRVSAPFISTLRLVANGANGGSPSGAASELGGSGSGGAVSVHARYILSNITATALGGGTGLPSGTGGEGRVRVDGTTMLTSNPGLGFVGPTIDTITLIKPPFTLSGSGEGSGQIELYSKTENTPWKYDRTVTTTATGRWSTVINYAGNDQYLYFVAAQKVSTPVAKNYMITPTHVLSPVGAVVATILKIAQVSCDSVRSMGTVSCAQGGTKLDTFYVRNLGNADVTLDSGSFQNGVMGFSVEDPQPFKSKLIKANDSVRVIVRFRQPANAFGVIKDRLVLNFPAGTFPQILTVDYRATVDTVGLSVVDITTKTEFRNGFAMQFDRVCASIGASQTFALKNISKGPVAITNFKIVTGGVFSATIEKKTLTPLDTAHFTVNVPPHARGTYYDTLLVSIDSCNIVYRIPLSVVIVDTQVFGYFHSLEDFSYVKVGKSLTHRFSIKNMGSGIDSADFRTVPTFTKPFSMVMIPPDTVPRVLAPGDSIVFLVTFTPDSARYYEQIIAWPVSQRGTSCPTSVIFTFKGYGTNSSIVPSKGSIDFGTVFQCTKKKDTIWIRNAGSGSAKVYNPATITGVDRQRFTVTTQWVGDSTTLATTSDSLMYIIEYNGDPTDMTTSAKTAQLEIRVHDDSAHTIVIPLTATQTRARLVILDALPIVVNNIPVNSSVSVQLGVKNVSDSTFNICNVVSQHEPIVNPDIRLFDIPGQTSRAFQFTITPNSLADIIDTATIYICGPCIDSLKIPIIAHPTNNTLLFNPRIVNFDTVHTCAKPSPITISIKNVDVSSQASIDTMYIEGPDVRVFQMNLSWTTFPYLIQPNFTFTSAMTIGYNGAGTVGGLKTAQLIIRYRINNQNVFDTIPIRAIREVPLTTDSTSMEFGSIKQGQTLSIPLGIVNNYSQQLDITFGFTSGNNGAFHPLPSLLPIPGKKRDSVMIEFSKDSTAEYRDTMFIRYFQRSLGCTDSVPMTLHGQILPGLNFSVWLQKNVVVQPTDKNVRIALFGKTDTTQTTAMKNLQFTAKVEIPADMYFPLSVDARGGRILNIGVPVQNRRDVTFSVDTLLNNISKDTTLLAYLVGDAMLGARECDSIRITTFDWTNSGLRPTTWVNRTQGNSEICTQVCNANGSRLLGGALTGLVLSLVPNPAESSTNMNIRTVETGSYTVIILNETGQVVDRYEFDAHANTLYSFDYNISRLSSGVYSVRLQAPTRFTSSPLVIIK